MKKNRTLIIVAAALLLLMGGAYALYGNLSQDAATDQLVVLSAEPSRESQPVQQPAEQQPEQQQTAQQPEQPEQQPEQPEQQPEQPEQQPEQPEQQPEQPEQQPQRQDPAPEEQEEQAPEAEKIPVPDFTVYDKDGAPVRLTDYVGKPIVLNFWASWCGPCQSEMPDFDKAYAQFGEDVQFLMVNVTSGRETRESASAFIEEYGFSFPVFYDTDSDAAATYGIYSLPTTIFIDAEGYAVAQAMGAIDRETLDKGISLIHS